MSAGCSTRRATAPKATRRYARQLAQNFTDNRGMLEDVLAALFQIAQVDGPVNRAEHDYLSNVHRAFGLDQMAWDRARGAIPRQAMMNNEPDAYAVLGITRSASDTEVRALWRRLVRENHPDSLAAHGVPAELIARASDKVARINAAWDRIKRERGL